MISGLMPTATLAAKKDEMSQLVQDIWIITGIILMGNAQKSQETLGAFLYFVDPLRFSTKRAAVPWELYMLRAVLISAGRRRLCWYTCRKKSMKKRAGSWKSSAAFQALLHEILLGIAGVSFAWKDLTRIMYVFVCWLLPSIISCYFFDKFFYLITCKEKYFVFSFIKI